MKNLAFITLISIVFFSCKKEELISNIPSIELIETSPTQVVELKEPIYFKISYRDGDGDLGENDPDVYNLILIDPRINIKYEYRISELVPGGAGTYFWNSCVQHSKRIYNRWKHATNCKF